MEQNILLLVMIEIMTMSFTDNTASSATNGKALIFKAARPSQNSHQFQVEEIGKEEMAVVNGQKDVK